MPSLPGSPFMSFTSAGMEDEGGVGCEGHVVPEHRIPERLAAPRQRPRQALISTPYGDTPSGHTSNEHQGLPSDNAGTCDIDFEQNEHLSSPHMQGERSTSRFVENQAQIDFTIDDSESLSFLESPIAPKLKVSRDTYELDKAHSHMDSRDVHTSLASPVSGESKESDLADISPSNNVSALSMVGHKYPLSCANNSNQYSNQDNLNSKITLGQRFTGFEQDHSIEPTHRLRGFDNQYLSSHSRFQAHSSNEQSVKQKGVRSKWLKFQEVEDATKPEVNQYHGIFSPKKPQISDNNTEGYFGPAQGWPGEEYEPQLTHNNTPSEGYFGTGQDPLSEGEKPLGNCNSTPSEGFLGTGQDWPDEEEEDDDEVLLSCIGEETNFHEVSSCNISSVEFKDFSTPTCRPPTINPHQEIHTSSTTNNLKSYSKWPSPQTRFHSPEMNPELSFDPARPSPTYSTSSLQLGSFNRDCKASLNPPSGIGQNYKSQNKQLSGKSQYCQRPSESVYASQLLYTALIVRV